MVLYQILDLYSKLNSASSIVISTGQGHGYIGIEFYADLEYYFWGVQTKLQI